MAQPGVPIPYEKQKGSPREMMCGAAALCMVYRSLGQDCTQDEIWQRVGTTDTQGRRSTRTFRMASDAMAQGLPALVLRARQPWPFLQQCQDESVHVILNHRIKPNSGLGHYSVLVSVDEAQAVVHDPALGPSRRLRKPDLLALWTPQHPRSEITGNVLVAVGAEKAMKGCPVCGKAVPETVQCLGCQKDIVLQPAPVLGCMAPACPGRTWVEIFCPHCDRSHVGTLAAKIRQQMAGSGEGRAMDPIAGMEELFQSILELQAMALATRSAPLDATNEQFLADVQAEVRRHQAGVVEAQQELEAARERMLKAMSEKRAKAEKVQAAAAAAAEQPRRADAAPLAGAGPKTEEGPIDPQLGQVLRRELLERFGNGTPRPGQASEPVEIWKQW